VLAAGFRSRGLARVFAEGWGERAREFQLQAVAGSIEQIDRVDVEISHAIVVLGRVQDARVSEADRERWWRRFGVPVFEQIIGERGELLAAECEAHDGLHLVDEAGRSLGGELDESPCGCGRKSPRLKFEEKKIAAGR